jgi:hypothetical protein
MDNKLSNCNFEAFNGSERSEESGECVILNCEPYENIYCGYDPASYEIDGGLAPKAYLEIRRCQCRDHRTKNSTLEVSRTIPAR